MPIWSPDGRHIAFFAGGKLRRIAAAGGTAETLADAPNPRGGAWGRGDVIVFAPASGGALLRIAASGGAVSPATRLDQARSEIGHRFPSFLPDGRRFLYGVIPETDSGLRVRLGTLEGTPRPGPDVVLASQGAVFAAPGYVLYGRRDSVVAQPFDPEAGRVTGPAVPIRDVPNVAGYAGAQPPVSASAGGVLVQSPSALADTRLVWLDRAGQILAVIPASDAAVALGAFLSHRGVTTFAAVFLVTWVSNLVGAAGVYFAARRYGRRLFASPTGRRLFAPRSLAIIERGYLRFGIVGIFISRFLPGIRAVVPPFAGLIGLGAVRTLAPMGLASAIWYGGLTMVGALIGSEWGRISALIASVNRTLFIATLVLAVAGGVWYLVRRRQRGRERVWHATRDALDPAAPSFLAGTDIAEGSARQAAAASTSWYSGAPANRRI